ncbi:hypothetical protein U1Q18_049907 [Sarracenia purpurea var. burkii]
MATYNSKFKRTWSRFVVYSSPGKLQEVACVPIAAYLTCCKKNEFFRSCVEYSCSYVDNIHMYDFSLLPSSVWQKIDSLTKMMWKSLREWWHFHKRGILEQPTEKDCCFEWIHLISWRVDGTVNYVQTARNLIGSKRIEWRGKIPISMFLLFRGRHREIAVKKARPFESAGELLESAYGRQDSRSYFIIGRQLRYLAHSSLFSANSSEKERLSGKSNGKYCMWFSFGAFADNNETVPGSDEEVASFKEIRMCDYSEIEYLLQRIVENDRFVELNEFLRFITTDPEVIFDLRIRILKSNYFLKCYIYSACYDKKVLFDKFVNETFTDADQLNEFKKYLITSEESMKYFRSSIEKARLHNNIQSFCDHILSSMPDVLTQVKRWLLEVTRDIFISAQFSYFSSEYWDSFSEVVFKQ